MPGGTFYGASIAHPKFAALSPATKWTFVELVVTYMDANNFELPDGFIHPEFLVYCSVGKDEALAALKELEEIGIVTKYADPEGWSITNFNKRAERYRPSSKETEYPNWGQQTLSYIENRRLKNAENTSKSRSKANANNSSTEPLLEQVSVTQNTDQEKHAQDNREDRN